MDKIYPIAETRLLKYDNYEQYMGVDEYEELPKDENSPTLNNFLNLQRAIQLMNEQEVEEFKKNVQSEITVEFDTHMLTELNDYNVNILK